MDVRIYVSTYTLNIFVLGTLINKLVVHPIY